MGSRVRDIKMWIKSKHWVYGQYRASGGKQFIMPAATRALYMPLQCINLMQNKAAVRTVFQCDGYDLWTMKQRRGGEKSCAALAEAERLHEYVQARLPNLAMPPHPPSLIDTIFL